MRIGDLIEGLKVKCVGGSTDMAVRVCDITEDSRTVMPGSLFVARRGAKNDGRQFAKGAAEAGAVAILSDDSGLHVPATHGHPAPIMLVADDLEFAIAQLAERFYGGPSSKLAIIGVTGTNGKTTITFLMHQMLNRLGVRAGLIGTVVIDDGVEVAPANMTTPPAMEVSRTLARMLDAGCRAAVMEVSSHSLHQRRVGALRFVAGVFTNLTGDHLDYHGTMEHYAAAKAMLFDMLAPDAAAVVNIADPWHTRMLQNCKARVWRCRQELPGALPITGGHAPESVFTARVVGAGTASTDIELSGAGMRSAGGSGSGGSGPHTIRIPLVGDFNVINALQALVGLYAVFGSKDIGGTGEFTLDQLLAALGEVHAPPGRLEPVTREGESISVFVDYAHTDDALQTVLGTLRQAMQRQRETLARSLGIDAARIPSGSGGQLWCVFGCGGDRDRTKRPRMGRVASELADQVIITSDNPRTEEPSSIVREIQTGIPAEHVGKVQIELDRERAIRLAIRSAKPGDTIIIAGKGHEDYQIFADPAKPGGTITRHFDDREVSRAALESRGIRPRPSAPVHIKDAGDPEDEVSAIASSD